mgnify:CR=1 FL=1|tara:strand:+ start:437 stop:1267 length:831 start_codon:yes stop_codon:yes gene_type:complete
MIETMKINNINKSFGDLELFKDLSFEFRCSKITLIVGENGAGKSTLLRILSGNQSFESGSITKNNDRVFYMREIPSFFDYDSVNDFCKFIALSYEGTHSHMKWMSYIADISRKRITNLSTGERQRVILVAGLISKAPIILLDEPTNGIDQEFKKKFKEIFNQFKKQSKFVIIATHLLEDFIDIDYDELSLSDVTRSVVKKSKPDSIQIVLNNSDMKVISNVVKEFESLVKILGEKKTEIILEIDSSKSSFPPNRILRTFIENDIDISSFKIMRDNL